MEIFNKLKLIFIAASTVIAAQSHAANIGIYTFDDNAYADQLVSGSGQFTNDGGINWYYSSASNNDWLLSTGGSSWNSSTAPTDATDNFGSTYLGVSNNSGSLDFGFTQTQALNGEGDDLAFFFLWDQSANNAQVSLNGSTVNLDFSNVLDGNGNNLYAHGVDWQGTPQNNVTLMVGTIELSDFGLTLGEALDSPITLNMTSSSHNDIMALSMVAALNSGSPTPVPVPAALWLFLSGLGVIGVMRRR